MKKVLGILLCAVVTVAVVGSVANACWMFLSIEDMEQQAVLIVVAELTEDIREVVNDDGSGVTFWSANVLHLLKGECESVIEVATGGLVTREDAMVWVSTDYRLDSFGQLFILYLQDYDRDGAYSPLTPRGIIELERSDGGTILGDYIIVSEQHDTEHTEIIDSVNSSSQGLSAEVSQGSVNKKKVIIPVSLSVLLAGSFAALAIKGK